MPVACDAIDTIRPSYLSVSFPQNHCGILIAHRPCVGGAEYFIKFLSKSGLRVVCNAPQAEHSIIVAVRQIGGWELQEAQIVLGKQIQLFFQLWLP